MSAYMRIRAEEFIYLYAGIIHMAFDRKLMISIRQREIIAQLH